MYSLSLNLMDLIIPKVIHFDFLCLCLLTLIVLVGKCLLAASVMVNSRMSQLMLGSASIRKSSFEENLRGIFQL